jgi:MATE family multidrug resistance protein
VTSTPLHPRRQEVGPLLRLAAPLIVGQVATLAMGFVDTVMAGRLSAQALAAVALGGAVWSSLFLFVIGTLSALSPSVAHLAGAGELHAVAPTVRQTGWIAAALSGLAVFVLVRTEVLLALFEVQPDVLPLAAGYLDALAWGIPGIALYMVLRYLSEGLAHTRPVLYIALLGLPFNVAGNWILMYGKLGAPALGAIGCGYATAIVFCIQGLAMTAYVARSAVYERVRPLLRWAAPDGRAIGELLWIGLPIGVALFLEVSLFATVALLMASFGTIAVAAHQIAFNFCALTFMVPLGVSMATTVRVGYATGRRDFDGARRAGWTGIGLAMAVQTLTAAVMLAAPGWIARIYTDDAQVRAVAVQLLMLAALFQLSDGAQVSASGALRGLKDTRVPMAITVVAYWLVGLPAGYLLGLKTDLGPRGLWCGFIGGLTVAAVLLIWRFRRRTHPGLQPSRIMGSEAP